MKGTEHPPLRGAGKAASGTETLWVRRKLEKPKATEMVTARCRAGDSPVLSQGLGWGPKSCGDSGAQQTEPSLQEKDCDVFGKASTSLLVMLR